MNIVITSQLFKAANWYNADNGTTYLNGCINDKIIQTTEFYIEKTALLKRLKFDSASKTITNANRIDNVSFIETYGYQIGEKITFTDTASNNSEFTITDISDRVITVSNSVVSEMAEAANIYLSSKITALDFYYNIDNINTTGARIRKRSQDWIILAQRKTSDLFSSLIDKSVIQRYSIFDGLDASNTMDTKYLKVTSEKNDWVTDVITGGNSECTIIGMGISSYRQSFKLIHTFFITPIWTIDKQFNFLNRLIPDNFLGGNSPSYVCRIDGKYNWSNPIVAASITDSVQGNTAWYNQDVRRLLPDYSFSSIAYVANIGSLPITKFDASKSVDVTLVIKSASGAFKTGSKFILNHVLCMADQTTYQDITRTLRQSLINDRAIMTIGGAAVNGEFYGTDYQVLTGCSAVLTNTETVTITFNMQYSSAVQTLLKLYPESVRQYALSVTAQDYDINSSETIDRINVLCDFQQMDLDIRKTNLINLVDYIRAYTFPDLGYAPKKTVNAYEGTPVVIEVPFQVNVDNMSPTIKNVGIQIVAVRDNKEDFVLEEKIYSVPFTCKTSGVQQINISETRGYKSLPDSPYNIASINNSSTYDATNRKGYLLHYGFIVRYEDWLKILTDACPDISEQNASLTQRWADIASWDLKVRFVADVLDDDGNQTSYYSQIAITIKKAGAAPESGPVYTTASYFLDENNVEVKSIVAGGVTKVIQRYEVTPADISNEDDGDTADGTLTYSFNLVKPKVKPGSLSVTVGTEVFSDNGDGTLTGDNGGAGTINYTSGAVETTSTSNPFPGEIISDYTYYPDLGTLTPYGSLTADSRSQRGGVTERRIANSSYASESDSPWLTPPDANPTADISYADGNARIDIFGNNIVVVSGNYKDSARGVDCSDPTNGGFTVVIGGTVSTVPSTGPTEERQWHDGEIHLWEDISPANWQ